MVGTYRAIFVDKEKHGETPLCAELQALSAQNMADFVRKLWGANVEIREICEIKDDWK